MPAHRVVVVGGGFGGMNAARHLRRAPVEVTLVDRRNVHVFQPLLYQVATGGLSPGDISSPLRAVLRRQLNARVLQATVTGLDVGSRLVRLDAGTLPYDTLVLAAGAENFYFGHDAWARHAPGLKSLPDALRIRSRILGAFECAERQGASSAAVRSLLTFVVVGGGPTGVELAGAIGELARRTLRGEFRSIDPCTARVLLVEMGPQLLPAYPGELATAAARALEALGVEVRTSTTVREIDGERVVLAPADGEPLELRASTVLWGAGVRPGELADALAAQTGARRDKQGRIVVEPDCSVPGHPEIFVVGDMAHVPQDAGEPVPGVAQGAIQTGRHVARAIADRLEGRTPAPFRYRNLGSLAVIGRAAAVADFGRLRFSGYPAWLLWVFVHIMQLVEYQNRAVVFVQWAFNYFTRNRGARVLSE